MAGFIERPIITNYADGQDITNGIAIGYDVNAILPTLFIIGDGNIARLWTGAIEEKQLVAFIEEALR